MPRAVPAELTRRALPAALALVLAACAPLRVDIEEQPAGYLATARGDDAEECREARARAAEEARYFCDARDHRTTLGTVRSAASGEGCVLELPFWCTAK
jgi:hypothetical protein